MSLDEDIHTAAFQNCRPAARSAARCSSSAPWSGGHVSTRTSVRQRPRMEGHGRGRPHCPHGRRPGLLACGVEGDLVVTKFSVVRRVSGRGRPQGSGQGGRAAWLLPACCEECYPLLAPRILELHARLAKDIRTSHGRGRGLPACCEVGGLRLPLLKLRPRSPSVQAKTSTRLLLWVAGLEECGPVAALRSV